PMLAYSPEYVALQTAAKIKADAVFIDCPHHALIKPAPKDGVVPALDGESEDKPKPPAVAEQEDERLLAESAFYQRLAQIAGYRTWNEAWDSLFEMREFSGTKEFRREL